MILKNYPITSLFLFFSISFILHAQNQNTTTIEDDDIAYEVTEDATNLIVNISTKGQNKMRTMMHFGLTIYFDVKGKKKKDVFVKYPFETPEPRLPQAGPPPSKEERQERVKKQPDIQRIIEQLPAEAMYSYFDNVQQFHKDLNSLDISYSWHYYNEDKRLEFVLKIPKHRITTKKITDITNLAIGVTTSKVEPNFKKNGKRPTSSSGMRQGRGQNRSGGQRGMKVGGQRPNTNAQQTTKKPNVVTQIFWFDANL